MGVGGNLVQLLDEHRALRLQCLDDGAVVHDLVADIDGCAVAADRLLYHADRAVHPGAESTWAGKHDQ